MALLKDPFAVIDPQQAKKLLDDKAQKIVQKGTDVSDLDLYNLCLINKERDEIDSKEE